MIFVARYSTHIFMVFLLSDSLFYIFTIVYMSNFWNYLKKFNPNIVTISHAHYYLSLICSLELSDILYMVICVTKGMLIYYTKLCEDA